MALAVDFFAVVDEWQSNLLDFAWTEVRVQARLLWSLVRMLSDNGPRYLCPHSRLLLCL